MSTVAEPPSGEKYVDFAEYVDYQLEKARRQIKTTDLLTAATVAAVFVLAYLLLFVVCDHWLIPGGVPYGVRVVGLVVGLTCLGTWLGVKLFWPWFKMVSGLFAAKEVERSEPALRNNLLNWVDLQRAGRPVDPAVLRAIERRAAVQLTKIDVAQAIDHRPLLRSGYALLATVALFCIYTLWSPKSVGPSLWRVLPLTETPAPTRTLIREVKPGDARVLARSMLEVTVELGGIIPPEVKLLYTTEDLKFQDEPVFLKPDLEGGSRFRGLLAGEQGQGLLRNLHYRIEAGDAVSRSYRVVVEQPPSAKVQQVRIIPPAYTRLPEDLVQGGNFRGWEGSQVEIAATANMPLHSASVQFLDEPNGKPTGEEEPVQIIEGTRLVSRWKLQFRADGTYPKYYRVQCQTADGRKDPAPLVYQYDILRDQPPEIALLSPDEDVTVPANAVLPLLAEARDPDFELGPVTLHLEREGQNLFRETLLTGGKSSARMAYDLSLGVLNLQPGDELKLYLEAQDNRQPRRNRRQTPPLRIYIEEPTTPQGVQEQLAAWKQRQQEVAEARDAEREKPPTEPPQELPAPEAAEQQPSPSDTAPRPAETQPGAPDTPQVAETRPEPAAQGASSKGAATTPQAESNQQGSSPASPEDPSERPLSPDGEDDQELLRRLHERLMSRQTAERDQTAAGSNARGSQTGQPNPAAQAPSPPGETASPADAPDPATPEGRPTRPGQGQAERPTDPASTDTPPSGRRGSQADQPGTHQTPEGVPPAEAPSDTAPPPPSQAGPQQAVKSPQASGRSPAAGTPRSDQPAAAETTSTPPADSAKPTGSPTPKTSPSEAADARNTSERSGQEPPTGQPGSPATPKPGEAPSTPDSSPAPAPQNSPPSARPETTPQNQPATTGRQADPAGAPMPQKTGQDDANSSPAESEPGPASSPRRQPTGGQPEGPDESSPGPGRKGGQRAEQPQTGEQGGSQQSSTGNPGRQEPGPGETATEPRSPSDPAHKHSEKTSSPPGMTQPPKTPCGQCAGCQSGGMCEQAGQAAGSKGSASPSGGGARSGDAGASAGKPEGAPSGSAQESQPGGGGAPASQAQPTGGNPSSASNSSGAEAGPAGGASASKPSGQGQPQAGQPGASQAEGGQPEGNQPGGNQPRGNQPGGGQAEGSQPQAGQPGGSSPQPNQPGANSAGAGQQPGGPQSAGGQPPAGGRQGAEGQPSAGPSPEKQAGGANPAGGANQPGGEGQPGGGNQPSQGASQGTPAGGQGQSASGPPSGNKLGQGDRAQGSVGQGGVGSGQPGPSEPQFGNQDPAAGPAGEEANAEFNRQAAELILQRLQKQLERGDVDPELLKELGWTEAEMRRFVERLSQQLSSPPQPTPEDEVRRLQFEEMLKSLDLRRSGAKRTASDVPKRSVEQLDSRRSQAPAEYRKAWETYTRKLLEQKKTPAP